MTYEIQLPPKDGKTRLFKCIICGNFSTGQEPPKCCKACSSEGNCFCPIREIKEDDTLRSDYKGTICIIGAGTAGIQAMKTIRMANKVCKVQLFSEEGRPYYRPTLTKKFSYVFEDKEDFFKEHNVELISEKVVDGDAEKKEIKTESGKTYKYDKLIISTGSNANNFYKDCANAFTINSLGEMDQVKDFLKDFGSERKLRLGIVGAGLLGIEFSEILHDHHHELVGSITMIEMQDRILPFQLDRKGGEIYKGALEKSGLNVKTGCTIKQLIKDEKTNKATHLILKERIKVTDKMTMEKETKLPVDMILITVGTVPNLELADKLGLKRHSNGKKLIYCDEHMESSKKGIYGCGNCAQHGYFNIPNYTMAIFEGDVSASNAIGIEKKFTMQICPYNLSSFGINAFSSGMINTDVFLTRLLDGEYIRLAFKKSKETKEYYLCGALFIARENEKAPAYKLTKVLKEKISMKKASELFF